MRLLSSLRSDDFNSLKPFLSISLIVLTLLGIVFLQMEERRLGYLVLKLSRSHRELVELKRTKEMKVAKQTRPQRVEELAQKKFTLKKLSKSQIIHLTGAPISVPRPELKTTEKAGVFP